MKTIRLSLLITSVVLLNNVHAQMDKETLFFSKQVQGTFEEVYTKVTQSVEKNGFGVVTELSLDQKLKDKLDVEIGNYHLLGVCNPKLAHEAIQLEENIGAFLPCKLIIRKTAENEFVVVTFNPALMMGIMENPELDKLANIVSDKLQTILAGIE